MQKLILDITKKFWLFIIVFLFFLILILIYLNIDKNDRIDKHVKVLEKNFEVQYSVLYDNFKKISQNTFYGIINKPQIFNSVKYAYNKSDEEKSFYRKKLYSDFLSDYNRLLNFDFKQIHFHFPDNTSFLRMHEPEKFGDELSSSRYSIKKVNETLKPLEGFEIGKIIHGYRFVYPLFDEKLFHIGSVEVSVASYVFEKMFEKNYNVDVHFLISKTICKEKMFPSDYKELMQSSESSDYLYTEKGRNEIVHYVDNDFFKDEKEFIQENMKEKKSFSLIKSYKDNDLLIYFKSISNVQKEDGVAYLVIYYDSKYIKQINHNYWIMNIIVFLILVIFMFYLYFLNKRDEKQKEIQEIMSQQTKLAAIGEMIGNIAHQWRQPLSVISTSASGIKMQKEFGVLDDETFRKSMDNIVEQTQYLSKTIEDFRNFFKDEKNKKPFILSDVINDSIAVFNEELVKNRIKIVRNLNDEISLVSYPEELKQVLVILLKNALDVMKNDGVILVSTSESKSEYIIKIKDSAGGIEKELIKKVFEPYITTKHKNVGVGMGLYMCYELVTKTLEGSINVKNSGFVYKFKTYEGAMFKITLPKDKK